MHSSLPLDGPVTSHQMQSMLIDLFGDAIYFTYPKDCPKSQMLYSTDIKCTDVAELLHLTDTIKVCAERLRDECCKFEFHLEETYNLAEDCNISMRPTPPVVLNHWRGFSIFCFLIEPNV